MIDTVIMNPPYSLSYEQTEQIKFDSRYQGYALAPKSKADYMFLLDALARLSDDGEMVMLFPHGVLFRGGAEAEIREKLIEQGVIDAIIGLPPKLFEHTGIPTVALVLKKYKKDKSIFIINADKDFRAEGKRNVLEEEHIEKILFAYKNKLEIDMFSRLVSYEEMQENDFNLNIPRYVCNIPPKPPVDIKKEVAEYLDILKEIEQTRRELYAMSLELRNTEGFDEDGDLAAFQEMFAPRNPLEYELEEVKKVEEAANSIKRYDRETGLPTEEMQQLSIDGLMGMQELIDKAEEEEEKLKKGKEWALDNMFV